MSQTTLVDIDIEAAPKLSNFIASLIEDQSASSEFLSGCEEMIRNSQTSELLLKFLGQSELILSSEYEQDAESCFQAFVPILFTLDNDAICKVIGIAVSQLTTSTNTDLSLRILVSLFNLLSSTQSKVLVLQALLKYAINSKLSSSISHLQEPITSWISASDLKQPEAQELFRLLIRALHQAGRNELALKTLAKILESGSEQQISSDVLELVVLALVGAISSPASSFPDRSELYNILSKHGLLGPSYVELSALLTALRILCQGNMEEFANWRETAAALEVFQKYNLSADAMYRNLRLLRICSLCATATQLSYSAVAQAIYVDEGEVEGWLVEAMDGKLLQGSMDQMTSSLTITARVCIALDLNQWNDIRNKLVIWRKAVNGIVSSMEKQ